MRKFVVSTLGLLLLIGCGASKTAMKADASSVFVNMDLVNVSDDKVKVSVDPGVFTSESISFMIPKTVPGTYSTDNYGKYIEDLQAFDYKGNLMEVSKSDENTWVIANAQAFDKLTYLVNDTYDSENEQAEAVFSPAGTNILKGENFMLNLHGFIGYFKGLQEVPYELKVAVPEGLVATTSLTRSEKEDTDAATDVYLAERYFEIIDNPILYAKPNIETFHINDIEVTLSVYSPNGSYTAASLRDRMEKMMKGQKAFLGDVDSTKEYSILLYLSQMGDNDANGFGALEHHTSTVVVLPEIMQKEALEQTMVDVVSHEFFHIVTPLNVHSKEVQYFDFNDPKMSQHLWMYEGTTEYFANLFQIQQGLIDEAEFYKRIMDKINNAASYDDTMSFTTMSKNVLKEPYEKEYANVYEKGALINMALDIRLRELSNGEKSVLWLMKELSRKYGENTPFEDASLIDEIVELTYPEIGDFFQTHVIGNTPIDYFTDLEKVGLTNSVVEKASSHFFVGEIPLIDVDQKNNNAIFVRKGIELNNFMLALGVEGGDIIKSINGTPINLETMQGVIGSSFQWTPETVVKMEVERNASILNLENAAGKPSIKTKVIVPMENADADQLKLRDAWMKG